MANLTEQQRDLNILEKIEQNPDATQASLASQLGVAVGTVNWHLKRLVAKGYVKVRRAQRRKLLYLITPEGIALRARLTLDYINSSFQLYRLVRTRVLETLKKLHENGISRVQIDGDSDVAEICKLTCLEQGFEVVIDEDAYKLIIIGLKIFTEDMELPEQPIVDSGKES